MIKLNIEIMFDTDKEYNGDLIEDLNELLNEESDVKVYVKEDVKWKELKEWIDNNINSMSDSANYRQKEQLKFVKQKMQELEGEKDD